LRRSSRTRSNGFPICLFYLARMRISVIAGVAGAAALLFGSAACSSETVVDKAGLATEVSKQLSSTVGHAPESVTCPEDVTAKVGATTTCDLSDAGETYGVKVTITSVEGTDVKFDMKVDDKPK
jgi:hypothetical protein